MIYLKVHQVGQTLTDYREKESSGSQDVLLKFNNHRRMDAHSHSFPYAPTHHSSQSDICYFQHPYIQIRLCFRKLITVIREAVLVPSLIANTCTTHTHTHTQFLKYICPSNDLAIRPNSPTSTHAHWPSDLVDSYRIHSGSMLSHMASNPVSELSVPTQTDNVKFTTPPLYVSWRYSWRTYSMNQWLNYQGHFKRRLAIYL